LLKKFLYFALKTMFYIDILYKLRASFVFSVGGRDGERDVAGGVVHPPLVGHLLHIGCGFEWLEGEEGGGWMLPGCIRCEAALAPTS
jgi:hypothetical protein